MLIAGGSQSRELAKKVARHLEAKVIDVMCSKFPDGEIYVRVFGEVGGEGVALLQSLARSPNDNLVELLLAADALRGAGCRDLIGVIPYMAYARQDARFNPGEPLSIGVVAKLLSNAGFSRLLTVDMHLHRVKNAADLFSIPIVNLTAAKLIADFFRKRYPDESFIVVGPDEESEQWASKVARELGADYVIFTKERAGPSEVRLKAIGEVKLDGKTALVVDDIISTGGTMAEAARKALSAGAEKVFAACVHPVLVGQAYQTISSAGAELVVGTDSVESPISKISIAPLLAGALRLYL